MDPPFTGVAVKVTVAPAHTGLAEAAMETLAVNNGFTVIVMILEVAGLLVAQSALEVKSQETISLLTGVYE